ncbi:unnamed protein product [Moneuplotes crassus]|uniref:Uncharacterized protein n=1 Tax=Euplotes crassus TaxID=5936 RepID=A0AAD2D6U9_EUPCR|nr:unnamed protein product [Moneuplotes crassus]
MKFPYVVILALIIGSTLSAAGDPHLRRAQELIDWIEGDMEGTIVVMFYDQNSPESRIKAMREEIEREILRPNSGFHYYEVDVVIEDYAGVIEMCELNLKEIKHSPTLMITSDGNGYWAHGQGAVQEIKYQLPNYSIDIRRELGLIRR